MKAEDDSTNGSGLGSDSRVNFSLVAAWPEPSDLESDILKPNKASSFQLSLKSALRTRKLYDALRCSPPTLSRVMTANPGIAINDAQDHLDNLLAKMRQI